MTDLEAYYNKFNEEKRLDSRHGRVEFVTSMHYIHQCLDEIVKERAKRKFISLISGREPDDTAYRWHRKGSM